MRVLLFLALLALLASPGSARVPFGGGAKTVALWVDRGVNAAAEPVVPAAWLLAHGDAVTTALVTTWHITWDGRLGVCGDNETATGAPCGRCARARTSTADPSQGAGILVASIVALSF